jgi:hypothetical protein
MIDLMNLTPKVLLSPNGPILKKLKMVSMRDIVLGMQP